MRGEGTCGRGGGARLRRRGAEPSVVVGVASQIKVPTAIGLRASVARRRRRRRPGRERARGEAQVRARPIGSIRGRPAVLGWAFALPALGALDTDDDWGRGGIKRPATSAS